MNLLVDRLLALVPGLEANPQALAEKLTLAGVAVERVHESADGAPLLDTDITSNRPDLLCYAGVARELSALWRRELKLPETTLREAAETTASRISVVLDAPERCRRYGARIVRGVTVGPSPPWLSAVLEASGIRPINNVVDVTNFVLLERNQPLHAFDLARITGTQIHVRMAAATETLRTLDGVIRKLDPADLVIADGGRALALAGIMGGADAEIGPGTKDVLIESAWFEADGIRRSARRHGLRTEASTRFERGSDPEVCAAAAERAAGLIAELCGGEILTGTVDVTHGQYGRRRIQLRFDRIRRVLGIEIAPEIVQQLLTAIDLRLGEAAAGILAVEIPGFRPDLEREIDLIEEIGRLHGYHHLQPRLLSAGRPPEGRTRAQERERLLRAVLEGAGFSEAVTLSMTDAASERRFAPTLAPLELANPLSDRMAVLRTTVVAGLATVVAHNLHAGADEVRVYEIARVFVPDADGVGVRESLRLGLAAGRRRVAGADGSADVRALLGVLELVAERLRLGPLAVQRGTVPDAPAAIAWGDATWGQLRVPAADVLRALDLERSAGIVVADLDCQRVLEHAPQTTRFVPFSRHPAPVRDISVFVVAATAADLLASVRRAAVDATASATGDSAIRCEFRIHVREHRADDGRVSLTLRATYSALDRTLSTEEVEMTHGRVREALRHDPRFQLREG